MRRLKIIEIQVEDKFEIWHLENSHIYTLLEFTIFEEIFEKSKLKKALFQYDIFSMVELILLNIQL